MKAADSMQMRGFDTVRRAPAVVHGFRLSRAVRLSSPARSSEGVCDAGYGCKANNTTISDLGRR